MTSAFLVKAALAFKQLSREHISDCLTEYMGIGADASEWGKDNFLLDLPGKWLLSFSVWSDRPVAYCIMSLKEGAVHIHHFMVAESHRGEGIGEMMLQRAKTIAAGRANLLTLKVHHLNDGAKRFYERHGFTQTNSVGQYCLLSCSLSATA